MRSRYTAFALGDVDHLAATWHPSTRPTDLSLDHATRWESLEILRAEAGQATDTRGLVKFRAHWVGADGARGILQETSRFVFQRERWWYLDGEVDESEAVER